MSDINIVNIVGKVANITLDNINNKEVVHLNIGVNKHYKDKEGKEQKLTTWYQVRSLNKEAIANVKNMQKGQYVSIEGKLEKYKHSGQILAFKVEPAAHSIASKHNIHLSGRLTKDITFHKTKDHKEFASFEIASNHYWKYDNQDKWQKDTEFVAVNVFHSHKVDALRMFQNVAIKKGDVLELTGELNKYESINKDGKKIYNHNVNILPHNSILLVDNKKIEPLLDNDNYDYYKNVRYALGVRNTQEPLKISR